jgi:hypothetical protein
MTRYQTFITWFSDCYGLLIDGHWVNPAYLFRHRLICFAASLCDYFARQHQIVQEVDELEGITPGGVKRVILNHIQTSWTDLVPAFEQLFNQPPPFLYHVGPTFHIFKKTAFQLENKGLVDSIESLDIDSTSIYVLPQNQLVPAHPAEKRSHCATFSMHTGFSPPSSPSQRKAVKRRKQGK